MRLISWNVNGLRAVLGKGALDPVFALQPDILCLQEIKALPSDLIGADFKDYRPIWNSAKRKGYSGTAVLTRTLPLNTSKGMPFWPDDDEGRVITCDFGDYFLVTVYTPNAQHGLLRLPFRQEWDKGFAEYLTSLDAQKPVVFCGDLNVAHEEIDLYHPKENVGNPGFTPEERAGFSALLARGFVDTFRHAHPGEGGHYTWWSYRAAARKRGIGWRIDYFGVSARLLPRITATAIHDQLGGSDHCPVELCLD